MKRFIRSTLSLFVLAAIAASAPVIASSAMAQDATQAANEAHKEKPTAAAVAKSDAPSEAPFVMPALETLGYAKPKQMGMQESYSPVKRAITELYDAVTIAMIVVVIFVTLLLGYVCVRFRAARNPVASKVTHNTTVEIVWTVLPILILIGIAIPTLRIHYGLTFNFEKPDMTLKVTGHQWYWSYEYPDDGIAFDSNLKKKEDLAEGEPYLLAVDNPVVVPVGAKINVEMTGADVIHSWAIPALGVKRDTVPGRLNQTWFTAEKEGIYYGQCSELCGKFHGFMPITIKAVSPEVYEAWKIHAKKQFAANRYGTRDFATR
jgi:cytochrome c oxidase subunit II